VLPGLPAALPRRASAYDVYQSGGAISPQALAAAAGSGPLAAGGVPVSGVSGASGSVVAPVVGVAPVPAADVTVPLSRRASFRGPAGKLSTPH